MPRRQGFLLCAFPALSTVLLASDGKAPAAPEGTSATDRPNERGVPALFSWGDVDGDGRLDLAAVSASGTLQLLANVGEGRFEDVTERVGLSEVGNAALALWADYDGDGRLDLFVGARQGASRLFHNEGGVFIDMSAGSGLASEGAVQSAQWLDHDGDGRLDLFVVMAEKNALSTRLFRGLEGGFFEPAELPLAGMVTPGLGEVSVDSDDVNPDQPRTPSGPGRSSGNDGTRVGGPVGGSVSLDRVNASGGRIVLSLTPSVSGGPSLPILASCLNAIRNQATPNTCIEASTIPTLNKLYPISSNLFVAVGGNVGIGTTSPATKLDVAGAARMSGFELPTGAAAGRVLTSDANGVGTWQSVAVADQWVDETGDTMTGTLTLNPGVDQALDVSTGSIYKGGALFIHTKGGCCNTAIGQRALANVTGGFRNTASGHEALFSNTTGSANTASGWSALLYNTTGHANTAIGDDALRYNTTGQWNTASGFGALENNTIGNENTAIGLNALTYNTEGSGNAASGVGALLYNTTGSSNTASGTNSLRNNMAGHANTAIGVNALRYNTTGSRNIALGSDAGSYLTTGDDNIAIGNLGVYGEGATIRIGTSGTHTRAFIAGVRGETTGVADAIPVLIDSAGQLGTVSSSRRFKKDIADMGDATERLLELRPVVFRYKQEQTVSSGEVPLEYGLIAEEVAEIFPDLVVYDEEDLPFTVKYHLLSSILLNELKKLSANHEREMEELRSRLEALESRTAPALPTPDQADSR